MYASYMYESFSQNMAKRYIVKLNADAAEIMGETKMRYVFESKIGAQQFMNTLQSNLDAALDAAQ